MSEVGSPPDMLADDVDAKSSFSSETSASAKTVPPSDSNETSLSQETSLTAAASSIEDQRPKTIRPEDSVSTVTKFSCESFAETDALAESRKEKSLLIDDMLGTKKVNAGQQAAESVRKDVPQKSDETVAVKTWLEEVGCSQYFDIFIEEGFDDIKAVYLIKEKDLEEMNVKRGHRRKILEKIESRKRASQLSESEVKRARSIHLSKAKASCEEKEKGENELPSSKGDLVVVPGDLPEGKCKEILNRGEGFVLQSVLQHAHSAAPEDKHGATELVKTPDTPIKSKRKDEFIEDRAGLLGEALADKCHSCSPPITQSDELAAASTDSREKDSSDLRTSPDNRAINGGLDSRKQTYQDTFEKTDRFNKHDESKKTAESKGGEVLADLADSEESNSKFTSLVRQPCRDSYCGTSINPASSNVQKPSSLVASVPAVKGVFKEDAKQQKSSESVFSMKPSADGLEGKIAGKEGEKQNVSSLPETNNDRDFELGKKQSDEEKQEEGEENEKYFDTHLPPGGDSPLDRNPPGVKVTFHALLHGEWNWTEVNSVVIRFEHPELGEWKWNTVEMALKQSISVNGVNLQQLSGHLILPASLSSQPIQYKYCVKKGKTILFEYLGNVNTFSTYANRILFLPKELQGRQEGYFVKYDDVIRKEPGIKTKVINTVAVVVNWTSRLVENQEIAIRAYFPEWTGFYCLNAPNAKLTMLAQEALDQLHEIVCQLQYFYSQESGTWDPGVNIRKVLLSVLKPKLDELGKRKPTEKEATTKQIISAIAIAVIIKRYNIDLASGHLTIADLKSIAFSFSLLTAGTSIKRIEQNFFKDRKTALEAVCCVCFSLCSSDHASCEWITTIPLFHFLAGMSEPHEVTTSLRWKDMEWWGLGKLEKSVREFCKKSSKRGKKFQDMRNSLIPLINLDPLLLRVLLYCVNFNNVKDWVGKVTVASEGIIAIVKKLELLGFGSSDENQSLMVSFLRNTLGILKEKSLETTTDLDDEKTFLYGRLGLEASVELLSLVCARRIRRKDFDVVRGVLELVFAHFQALHQITSSGCSPELEQRPVTRSISANLHQNFALLEKAAQTVGQWIDSTSLCGAQTAKSVCSDIKLWSDVVQAGNVVPEVAEMWDSLLTTLLREMLQRVKSNLILESIGTMYNSRLPAAIDNCLAAVSEAALKDLIKAKKDTDLEQAFSSLSFTTKNPGAKAADRFRLHLEDIFIVNTPSEDASDEEWLDSLISWPLWRHYLRHSDKLFHGSKVSPKALLKVAKAKSVLENFSKKVAFADIIVDDFNFVYKHRKKIGNICSFVDEATPGKERSLRLTVEKAFSDRHEELCFFEEEKRLVLNFASICRILGRVDLGNAFDDSKCDVSNLPIRHLVERDKEENMRVVHFSFSPEIRDYIIRLNRVQDSLIFKRLWREQSTRVNEERAKKYILARTMTVDELVHLVISPVFCTWKQLCENMRDGKISLKEIRRRFINISVNAENELWIMSKSSSEGDTSWMKKRKEQIQLYSTLTEIVDAARTVLRVSAELNASEPFPAVEEICRQVSSKFHEQSLSAMTPDLILAGQFLASMKKDLIDCLQKFIDCKPLIEWIREEIREWKELETFVELAGTRLSAEGDFEAFKFAHLRAACAGFAPLLFDLKKGANLPQFLSACNAVYENLKRDKEIARKWCDSQMYLQDFKAIKDTLGSVEVSSFSEVELINSRGQFTVGCLSGETPGDIADCITLKIKSSPTDGTSVKKSFSLSDLQDLQSKLILISGHGSEKQGEVNVFIDTLENVTRLATNLIALCRAGHVKYFTWKRNFDCVSPFTQNKEDQQEAARKIKRLFDKMKVVADEMDSDLKVWKTKMNDVRSKFYYVNYFTTLQLLILGKHLGPLAGNKESKLDNFVYGLLECIKPNICADDVSVAIEKACCLSRRQSNRYVESSSEEGLSTNTSFSGTLAEDNAVPDLSGQDLEFVDDGLELGINEFVGQQDLCLRSFSSFNVASITNGWLQEMGATAEHGLETSIQNTDNNDYLSFETLGKFLQNLADSAPRLPPRSFPGQLELGFPNLIVVPQAELLPSVFRLYMADPQPLLPSAQEVLLCTAKTTLEDVTLFWRRAIKDPSQGRLFCLAGADRLNYEISKEAVDELFKSTQGLSGQRGESYRLVVVCSSENEDKSYMISALDQHRRLPLPCPSARKIQTYLKAQFQQEPASLRVRTVLGTKWAAAAEYLDHEKCCVRVVYSTRAGVGKSLFVSQMAEKLNNIPNNQQAKEFPDGCADPITKIIVPLHELSVNTDSVLETLELVFPHPGQALSRLIHLDISSCVRKGLEEFLFSLLILGQITDSKGRVWHRRLTDMYVLEFTWCEDQESIIKKAQMKEERGQKHIPFQFFLPAISRGSPLAALSLLEKHKNPGIEDPSLSEREFGKSNFQRVFQYLSRYAQGKNLDKFTFRDRTTEGTPPICLKTLLDHCGVPDPSWAILHHFVNFLSSQLCDCESSDFCSLAAYGTDLPGFKNFVTKLMILMSRDFSSPSIGADLTRLEDAENLKQYQLRRKWEQSPHPYLFFNEDRHTMTPIGLQITREGQLVNPRTGAVLDEKIMSRRLSTALNKQGFQLQKNYEQWSKEEKIQALCNVMGLEYKGDPDPTYELTTDNVIKILAIHMRFRCGIPVVVMGETGCGKTRLIQFMCSLQARGSSSRIRNMLMMKVHGGISRNDIIEKVQDAQSLAKENATINVNTVLFFDEANTTDAVGLIKEIMCDGRVNGNFISGLGSYLHVIAACNPYRKHTDVMIRKLESAGLGYHVRTGETEDRLGDIPLRQLVYRVHPLPESLKALVWDFGQLNPDAEELYIRRIVSRHVLSGPFPDTPGLVDVVAAVLTTSQAYMRNCDDECSFVSLRDVERTMMVMAWFYKLHDVLDSFMEDQYKKQAEQSGQENEFSSLDPLTRSLVLALGVSYQARLQERTEFRKVISQNFRAPCLLPGSFIQMQKEIDFCQTVFLDELELPPKIGRNHALKENVFMMVVCIDLRIPLFLVGKPGSSKSLAKDVVKNAMRGNFSDSKLFKKLKQAHMISYQCSPLSTADGIISTFSQCQRMQNENDSEHFVACVVLDEVGLAEDSPRLPLKALHPLLDDGTSGADDDVRKASSRVAFVGISNWALDPAKMNRGILVQREVPSSDELIVSAQGICSSSESTQLLMQNFIFGMATAYLEIYHNPGRKEREFFGLRDFYSLIKMVFSFCKKTGKKPSSGQLTHAIRRNFGGLDGIDPVKIFQKHIVFESDDSVDLLLDNTPSGLIHANLNKTGQQDSEESRYLLLLTENYAALTIVRQRFLGGDQAPVIIFGSSFSKDQEYTQICRNINRVKVCMATGRTVVLLNLDKLYESLYDALNQYYVFHGGQRFVDLGLGSHRVKCLIHKNFRLILIADSKSVYNDFPIPLINRMEKHFLAMSSILTDQQEQIVDDVNRWVSRFSTVNRFSFREENCKRVLFKPGDAFVGYHPDAVATVVLRVCRRVDGRQGKESNETYLEDDEKDQIIFTESCRTILLCATPDAVARLQASNLREEASKLWEIYFRKQSHSSLVDFLYSHLPKATGSQLIQVTTHSRLLSGDNVAEVEKRLQTATSFISLQQFDTEQQFCSRVWKFYFQANDSDGVLIVFCESGDVNGELIACARNLVEEQRQVAFCKRKEDGLSDVLRHTVFVIHLPRIAGGCFVGFQGGAWTEVHIDDLRPADQAKQLFISSLVDRKLSTLFEDIEPDTEDDQLFSQQEQDAVVQEANEKMSPELIVEGVEDIDTNRAVTLSSNRLPEKHSILNAAVLFRSCVHAATSRIDDPVGSPNKAANSRLNLLLRLIPENETSCSGITPFYLELKRRVTQLLMEREERAGEELARDWVKSEALNQNSIQAGGTFRHSLWLKIVNVVTPIFAEIVAFLDVNSNLDLLQNLAARRSNDWIGNLWLKFFASPQVTPLHYADFLSPTEQEPRLRVLIKGSGYNDHFFKSHFPFSWFVKDAVDEMLEESKSLAAQERGRLTDALQRLYDASPVGRLIQKAGTKAEDVALVYLHDFVHMIHNPKSKEDFELVYHAICSGINESAKAFPLLADVLSQKPVAPSQSLTIPAIHVAYTSLRARLTCYSNLILLNSSLIVPIYRQRRIPAGEISARDEMTLDAVAFTVLLESLHLKQNDLSFQSSRLAWLQRVQEVKPCVETWLALPAGDLPVRKALSNAARTTWTKICAVRLYFEHTKCVGNSDFAVKAGEKLWKCFENYNPDFATKDTIDLILRFLNETSSECSEDLFGPNGYECAVCNMMWKDPVELPCKHIFCAECIKEGITGDRRSCPTCRKEVPHLYNFVCSKQLTTYVTNFVAFRKACTAFFMEVVATYSFKEHSGLPPEPALVYRFMDLITQRRTGYPQELMATRAFSPFKSEAIDATPVFRSFLLQLLLRNRSKESRKYVRDYFESTQKAVREHAHGAFSQQAEEELALIFVQCIEDSISCFAAQQRSPHSVRYDRLEFAVRHLKKPDQHSLLYFNAIASARFALRSLAVEILYVLDSADTQLSDKAVAELDLARQLCFPPYDQHIVFFLLKQLVKRRNTDVLKKLQNIYQLKWLDNLVLEHTKNDKEVIPDYFLVIGDDYKAVRESVARAILTESSDPVAKATRGLVNFDKNSRAILVLLALYREVTMCQAHEDDTRHVTKKAQDLLEEYCFSDQSGLSPWAREISSHLLNNTFPRDLPIFVTPGQSLLTRAAAAVALHVRLVIESSADKPLMRPLFYMLKEPARLAESFLPTMPEDEFEAVRSATYGNAKVHWHRCPKGHPYFIDRCGGAVTLGKCFCGSQIGGRGNKLEKGNAKGARASSVTETGYILGQAAMRSDSVTQERDLSSSCCALVRMLMHASFMWACVSEDERLAHVARLVKPPVRNDQLAQFFWNHFEKDFEGFAKTISRTPDDATAVLHWFLDSLVCRQVYDNAVGDGTLKSKKERRTWEISFRHQCIDPALQEMRRSARTWINRVINSEGVGSNPLIRFLYELEAPPGATSLPSLWRFRTQVTVEDLSMALEQKFPKDDSNAQFQILRKILREEVSLRTLQCLPQILHLQRMLLEKFHRRLTFHEAATCTIGEFLQSLQERERQKFKILIANYADVWKTLKSAEVLRRHYSRLKLEKKENQLLTITEKTPIAYLLPTVIEEKGRWAVLLIDYLINCVHNEFVDCFRRHSGLQGMGPVISMNEVTHAQLISYDFERDLFPLFLAHCNYSLEVGKGSDVEYNFVALERQLIDRFLAGKPHIQFETHQFAFTNNTYSTALFGRIEQKVPQEKLSVAIAKQILSELRDLTEVYSILSVLDVLIGFMVSIGGDKEALIDKYLHETLKMPEDRGLVSTKARQYCKLKHTLSLWRFLMVEKGRQLVLSKRDPFEDFSDIFKKDMEDDLQRRFVECLRKLDLDTFMSNMMELAWLEVKNRNDVQGLDEYPLKDAMEEFCHSRLKGLSDFPDDVKLCHLLNCWSSAVQL